MERLINNLGWYFSKGNRGLSIIHKAPPKSSPRKRFIKIMLLFIFIIIAFLVFLNFSGYILEDVILPIIAFIPIIFLIYCFIYTNIFLKYLVISVNHLSSSLIINGVTINRYGQNKQIPCYLFKAEIDHTTESGLYRVYLRPSEFLEVEEPSEDWNPLVWETTDEKEAAEIVEELCQCGVGETNPEKQCQVIPGNKKIGIAVLTCWILCLLAIIFYLMHSIQSEISNPNSIESPLLLVKTVVIFGLLSFIVYACYKIWFGYLAIKHRQIPPPNTIVFLDTIFFKGEKAVKHGRKIVAFGFIAIVVGLLIAIYADYKLKEMIPNQNNQQTLTTNQNQ